MYSLALLAPGLLLATGETALVERVARDTHGVSLVPVAYVTLVEKG